MPAVVTLSDFRPPRRADGVPWTKARIDVSDSAEEPNWSEEETIDLNPVDKDPFNPGLRSFSVSTDKAWARIVFLDDAGGEGLPSALIALSGAPFQPTVEQVSTVLRARTYSATVINPDEPMKALAGGELQEEFNENTRPTAAEVERQIEEACTDVARALGYVPGEMLDKARRVASLHVAGEIERSYIPEQAEDNRTIFQTLRMTYAEDLGSLAGNLRLWLLVNRGME